MKTHAKFNLSTSFTKKTGILLISAFLVPASLQAALIKSFEFNSDGVGEGFTTTNNVNTSGITVASGLLTGTATTGDPRLINIGANAVKASDQTWSTIVFRVRETTGAAETPANEVVSVFSNGGINLVLNSAGNTSGSTTISSGSVTGVDSGDGFFTLTADISSYTNNTIEYLRVDPIGLPDAANNKFEVDFIRFGRESRAPPAALGE